MVENKISDPGTFPNSLKYYRELTGLSQAEFGEKCVNEKHPNGLAESTIVRMERGRRNPHGATKQVITLTLRKMRIKNVDGGTIQIGDIFPVKKVVSK